MSNELNFAYAKTGATVTAKLYINGAQVGSTISCTEISSSGGCYTANMPIVSAGVYQVYFYDAGTLKGSGQIVWNGTSEVTIASIPVNPLLTTDDRLNTLDVAISSRMATFTYTEPDNTGISNITAKLPSAGAKMAGEGATAKNLDQVTTDLSGVSTAIGDIASDVELIRKMTNGRWKIANNQMIFYDADNTTVVATYDLKDSLGNPTMSAPFERVKV